MRQPLRDGCAVEKEERGSGGKAGFFSALVSPVAVLVQIFVHLCLFLAA